MKIPWTSSLVCLLILFISVASAKSTKNLVRSSSSENSVKPGVSKEENLFVRLAKGVASEAINDLKEESRRNPRFGMTFDFSNMTSLFPGNGTGNGTGLEGLGGLAALAGIPVTIKVGGLGLKSAVIGGLVGIKAFIFQIAISILWLAFLISGTAYFVCNLGLVSCGSLGGGLGNVGGGGSGGNLFSGFGGSGSASSPLSSFGSSSSSGSGSGSGFTNPLNFFSSRSGVAQEAAQPIYKALDEGYKKYQ